MRVETFPAQINVLLTVAEAEALEEVLSDFEGPLDGLEKALHEAIHKAQGKSLNAEEGDL